MTAAPAGPSTTPPTGVVRPPTMVFGAREDVGWRPAVEVLVTLVVLVAILGFAARLQWKVHAPGCGSVS